MSPPTRLDTHTPPLGRRSTTATAVSAVEDVLAMDTQEDTEQIGVENGSSIRKGQPCGTTIKPLPKKVGNGRKIETATTRQHLKPRANYTCYQYSAHGTQGHTDSGSGRCSPRPPSQVWGERILRTQSLH